MEAVKFIRRLVKFGILGLVLVGLNGEITQAQRSEQSDGSIDLLSLDCVSSGQGNLHTNNRVAVSIGKKILTPPFFINLLIPGQRPFLLTCRLNPSEQLKTFQLIVGIKDYAMEAQHEITFKVYLDGQETASHALTSGEERTLLLDVTKTNNIAIEAACSFVKKHRSCPSLLFIEASILPSPTSSLTNSNSTAFNNF